MLATRTLITWMALSLLGYGAWRPAPAQAINFATASKGTPGYQLKLYPFRYEADTRTNHDGDPAVSDLGLRKYGVVIANNYQVDPFLLSTLIPVSKLSIAKLKDNDTGLGDIQLRAGWYLPVTWASIMPALTVKLPTAGYDRGQAVHLGDGQSDLIAELFFFKLLQPLSFDALLKYAARFRNPDTDLTPGNEFTAEGLLTWRLAEKIRIGPAVNFTLGGNNNKNGQTLPDSGLLRLAAGGEIYFGRFEQVKISLAVYQDLLTRNTTEGIVAQGRLAFAF